MTLILELTPEQEEALRQKAAREGRDEREYALGLLDGVLGTATDAQVARPFYETATTEEWIAAFHEWVHSHDPNTPVLADDSRADL